jgi:hypothetical protein
VTTEAGGRYHPAGQMALVRELVPEAVSLALGELVPDAAAPVARPISQVPSSFMPASMS